mmetsp:Transcript_2786/g.17336  ORF Transcript_2786/g.17336 Transcript_2786/m.17336 type:complete len:101 (+) Transcript_2786:112-414(+)
MGKVATASLAALVGERVCVLANDGRTLVGRLRGCDQATNVVLEECVERVFSMENGVEIIELGCYVVRGDNIAVVGQLDTEKEASTDLAKVKAEPLKPIVH